MGPSLAGGIWGVGASAHKAFSDPIRLLPEGEHVWRWFPAPASTRIATVVLQIIDSEKESESFPKTAVEIKKLKVVGNGEIKFKVGTLCNF